MQMPLCGWWFAQLRHKKINTFPVHRVHLQKQPPSLSAFVETKQKSTKINKETCLFSVVLQDTEGLIPGYGSRR